MIDLSLFGASEEEVVESSSAGEVQGCIGDSEKASAARNGLDKKEVVYPKDYRLTPDEIKSYSVRVDGVVVNIAFHNWHELWALCQKLKLSCGQFNGLDIRELEDDEMREYLKINLGPVHIDERIHVVRPRGYLSHGERRSRDHKNTGGNRSAGLNGVIGHAGMFC